MKESILFILGAAGLFAIFGAVQNYTIECAWVFGIGFGIFCLGALCYAVGSLFLD